MSDGKGTPDYLNLPEPRTLPRTARRPVLFIEEDIQFLSCMAAARYCKEHYSEQIGPKATRTIGMGIGQVCDGAMDDYKGLHFKEIIVQ